MILANANIDAFLAGWFHERLSPAFAAFLQVLSGPGSDFCIFSLVIFTALLLTWTRSWYALLALLLTVPGGALFGEMLKLIIQRPRPFIAGPFGEWGGYSFPSGHTIAATLFYGFLAVLIAEGLRKRESRYWRFLPFFISAILITGVGFSRIALGAHYFTDVLAAMILGTLWIAACMMTVATIRRLTISPAPEASTI